MAFVLEFAMSLAVPSEAGLRMTDTHELDELFVALGEEVLSSSRMGASVSQEQKYNLGRNWFESHFIEIKSVVCSNNVVKDLADKSDTAALVTALTPLLGFSTTATAMSVVATLLIRIGIRRVCSEQWRPSSTTENQ